MLSLQPQSQVEWVRTATLMCTSLQILQVSVFHTIAGISPTGFEGWTWITEIKSMKASMIRWHEIIGEGPKPDANFSNDKLDQLIEVAWFRDKGSTQAQDCR